MGEMLKFVTPDEGLRKKASKKFLFFFAKITQFSDLFRLNFALKDLFCAAQNVRKISKKELEGTS